MMVSVTTSRHSWETSRTLALSTLHSLPPRLLATSPVIMMMIRDEIMSLLIGGIVAMWGDSIQSNKEKMFNEI